ncbi:YidC/Oxa1 family membrane protein insertase [Cellulosimicrobium cellulans]|uniref:YidC/Oxa1 family membrane protein insertase n=1 Tax=Cellulosimicrobium cellulans TaxID=1710 RepID=UPI0024064433|nr:membrane protein insertase YidC [Cellulosimicrobium cellulans]MDF9878173.1 YidC/Oxa1 family membrane protein insertase [Cellulosimicrobium cellulans]
MNLLDLPLVSTVLDAAYRALMGLSDLLEPVAGGAAAAAAVVLLTLAVRALLVPVGVSQARAERDRARLAPRLAELQRRHRDDPQKLQRATLDLYAEEGTTPFAGCLPMLAQAPVVAVVYALFLHTQIAGHANALLGHTLWGAPLGSSLVGSLGAGAAAAPTLVVTGGVVLLIALVGELTRRASLPGGRLAVPRTATGPGAAGAGPLAAPGLQNALGALQFMTAVIACFVPLAAGVYLLVTVAWTLAQRLVLRRRYPFGTAV